MTELSIIIPTLNEAANIDRLLTDLERTLSARSPERYEIIIVDDASTDGTVKRAHVWQERLPIRVIQRHGSADLSAAIRDGVEASGGQYIVVMDADGSHPPDRIPELLRPLQQGHADVVIGSRHVRGARTLNWPWRRHISSKIATLLAWPFTEVKDPMAGFFATSRQRLAALPQEVAGYKILLEMLVQGGDAIRVTEIPIRFEDRQAGQSKLSLAQQLTYLRRLMNLGGGRVSGKTATRFLSVGLLGLVVDLIIFTLLFQLYGQLALAHMVSFGLATVSNFAFNWRWTFDGQHQTQDGALKRYIRFLIIAMLALLMRGGVIVLLVETWGISPYWAILPAIASTVVINYLGSAFYVFSSTASGVTQRVRWHLAALGLFAYTFALRWLYLGQVNLLPDEMYYWVYSQHLALSYLDHPPLTGWLIGLTSPIFGQNPFGVRASLIGIVLLGAYYFYRYGASIGGQTLGLLTMLALVALPFFFLSGLVMTPDAPMIVAWAATLYYLKRLLIDDEGRAWWGLGVAMGLGLLAKYSIALLGLAGFVFMLADQQARRWFARPHLYGSTAIAMIIFSPVIWWNSRHEWASFGFQFTRRLIENPDFTSHWTLIYAFLLLSPVFCLAAFWILARDSLADHAQREKRFMWIMTIIPLAVFMLYGAFSVTKFHWTLPAWIALIPAVMGFLIRPHLDNNGPLGSFQKALVRSWAPSLLALMIAYGSLLHYLILGLPGIPKTDLGTAYLGWEDLTQVVIERSDAIERETGEAPIIAATDKWGVAAALYFHAPERNRDHITAQNLIGMSGSMWAYWFDHTQEPQRPILLVHHSPKLISQDWINGALVGVSDLEVVTLTPDHGPDQTLYIRTAEGFRPEQLRTPDRSPPLP